MGVEDRDWWKDAQDKREGAGNSQSFSRGIGRGESGHTGTGGGSTLPRSLRWGPLGIVLFWLVLMGAVYVGIQQVMKPREVTVSVSGDITLSYCSLRVPSSPPSLQVHRNALSLRFHR